MRILAILFFLTFVISASISRAGYRLKVEGKVVKVENGFVYMMNKNGSAQIPLELLPEDLKKLVNNSVGKSQSISFMLNPELL